MRNRVGALVALGFLAMLCGSAALAQKGGKPSPLIGALAACRAVADPAQRLACFDKASANLIQATTIGDVSIVDRAELRQARRSLFGFNMPKLPFFAGDKSADEVSDTLAGTVTWVRATGNDRYQVRLQEGGALWETLESYSSFHAPKVGSKVEIKRGPLGSYMLRFDGRRGVKGKRIG